MSVGLFFGWLWGCVRLEVGLHVKHWLRKSRIWSKIRLRARSCYRQHLLNFQKFRIVQTKQAVSGTRRFLCRLCRAPPQVFHWSQMSLIKNFPVLYFEKHFSRFSHLRQDLSRWFYSSDFLTKFLFSKGKANPLQALTGPGGSSRLRLPDFETVGI
jgi:hypothetical protein